MTKRYATLALLSAAGLALAATQAVPVALAAGANVCTTQNASACASSLSASAGQSRQSQAPSSQGHTSKRQAHRHEASNSRHQSHKIASHHSGRAATHKTASSHATGHGTTAGNATGHGTTAGGATPLNLPPYAPGPSNAPPSTQLDTSGLLLLGGKFAIVLVLLLVCLRVLRAVMPRLQGARSQKGALVLHEEAVGDKGRVMLLDLETRLVVVGATGTTINGLTTIDDPAEVAQLRERYRPEGRKAPLITIQGAQRQDPEVVTNVRSWERGHLARPPFDARAGVLPGSSRRELAGPEQADEEAEMPSFATLLARNTLSALRLGPAPHPGTAGFQPAPARAQATIARAGAFQVPSGHARFEGPPVTLHPAGRPAPTQETATTETRETRDEDTLDHTLDALRALRRRVEIQ